MQDRDGARLVLDRRTRRLVPFIERIFADAGYQGAKTAAAIAKTGSWKLEIVKRNELHTFAVLPKVWVVERSFGWLEKCRRLWKNCELKPPTQKIVNRHYSTFTASSPFSRNR